MRSVDASNDHATTAEVILEVLNSYKKIGIEFEYFCCIYPTAPFITAEKLQTAYEMLVNSGAKSLVPIVSFSFPILRSFKIEEGYVATLHTKEEWYVRLSSGHHRQIIPWTHQPITISISASSNVSLPYASLYEHDAFDGLRADVLETRMSKVPIGISSLSVQSGYAIRLYTEEEFKGRNVLVIGMVKSLTVYTFNDEVRSLEVVTTEHADEQPMLCKESTCYTLPLGKTVSYDEILWNPHNLNVPQGYIVSIERFGYMMQYVNGHDQIEFNWSWLFPVKAYVVTKL